MAGEDGVTAKGNRAGFGGNKNVLKWTVIDTHWIIHFNWMNCMACNFSLNKAVEKKSAENYTHSGEGMATHKFTQAKKKKKSQQKNTYSLS